MRRVRTPKPPRARRLGVVISTTLKRCRTETYLGFDANSKVGKFPPDSQNNTSTGPARTAKGSLDVVFIVQG